ncbi:MAG: 4'-phosphopantetheinyl transferase superfamily protein [Planctomycetota bacterium]
MILQLVLVPIPLIEGLSPPQRVQQQRDYARRALRHCAGLCGAPTEGWLQSPDGAPLPLQGYHWSIAHKRRWAAAVIADHPVGIDIEHVTPRRHTLFDAVGGEDEWRLLGDRSWHSFFRLFTAKEATLKANGVGIGYLSACRVVKVADARHVVTEFQGRTWHIEHFEHDDHIAAVTCIDTAVCWRVLAGTPSSGV